MNFIKDMMHIGRSHKKEERAQGVVSNQTNQTMEQQQRPHQRRGLHLHHTKEQSQSSMSRDARDEAFDPVMRKQNMRFSAVCNEIRSTDVGKSLHHTEIAHDASAPVIEKDVRLRMFDRRGAVEGVGSHSELHHVETNDRSAPFIDPNMTVNLNRKGELMNDIERHEA